METKTNEQQIEEKIKAEIEKAPCGKVFNEGTEVEFKCTENIEEGICGMCEAKIYQPDAFKEGFRKGFEIGFKEGGEQ